MPTTTTPYMGLLLPVPGSEPGPTYATDNNTAFTTVDSHNHTSGQGIQIPSAGLNINADLPFGGFNAITLRSSRFSNQGSPLSGVNDLDCLYSSGNNLYWNNGSGQQVQITAGAALNAASIGGIGGDYITSGASEFYTNSTKTFSFTQAANTSASLDAGSITIRENVASAKGITISSPTSLAANYSQTLPTANPASVTSLVAVSTAGVWSYAAPDNSTLQISSGTLQVKDAGITQAKLAVMSTGQSVGAGGIATAPVQTTNPQSTNATANTDITGVNVTITTTGRPVFVGFIDATAAGSANLQVNGPDTGFFAIVRGASTAITSQGFSNIALTGVGAVWGIDVVAAGTYTYKAIFHVSAGTTTVTTANLALIAYEI